MSEIAEVPQGERLAKLEAIAESTHAAVLQLGPRIDQLGVRIDQLGAQLGGRIDQLGNRLDKLMMWLLATAGVVIIALVGVIFRALHS